MVWYVASWCIIVPAGQSSMITSMRLANLIAEYFYIFIKASYMGMEVHIAFKFFFHVIFIRMHVYSVTCNILLIKDTYSESLIPKNIEQVFIYHCCRCFSRHMNRVPLNQVLASNLE